MKKTLQRIGYVVILAVILLALTGCGNKIVATKQVDDLGVKYEETIEIGIKKDKVSSMKYVWKFEDESAAQEMKKTLDEVVAGNGAMEALTGESLDTKVEQKGKKITVTFSSDKFGTDSLDLSDGKKEELIKSLEDSGYKVK